MRCLSDNGRRSFGPGPLTTRTFIRNPGLHRCRVSRLQSGGLRVLPRERPALRAPDLPGPVQALRAAGGDQGYKFPRTPPHVCHQIIGAGDGRGDALPAAGSHQSVDHDGQVRPRPGRPQAGQRRKAGRALYRGEETALPKKRAGTLSGLQRARKDRHQRRSANPKISIG